jgi:hypothetical protein
MTEETRLIPKKSNVAAKVPLAAQLDVGEVAVNFPDRKIYTKDPQGAVIELSAPTNLGYTTAASAGTVTSSTGASAVLPAATQAAAGLLTAADKTKLDGVAAGAQVNVGTNLGITGTGNSRTITSSTGSDVTIPVATTTTAGWLSTADKTKLDSVQAGAQANVGTDLGITGTGDTRAITSSTGANVTVPVATTTTAGLMSFGDKTKLDGVAVGATANAGTVTNVAAGTGLTGGPITSTGTLSLTGQALAVHNLATNGLIARTAANTVVSRSVAAGTGITVSNGDGVSGNPTITNSAPHIATNLSYTTALSSGIVVSSTGTSATLPAATTLTAGLLTSDDKSKLDGIEAGANNYSLPTASSTILGGVLLGSDAVQTSAPVAATATASRTYMSQLDSSGAVVVNVPWVNTTYSEITTAEIDAGTSSTLRTITGRRMGYALGSKADLNHGHDTATALADGFMSATDKAKLDGVTAGATANTGTVTSVAATAGTGISVSGSPITSSGTLTITNTAPHQATNLGYTTAAATGTVTSSTGTNATLPAATTALAGLLTGADKTKLDGIQAGAQVNVAANLGYTTAASNGTITSSTGTSATLPAATTALAGLLTGADKTKLDGIQAGAQVNVATNLGITGTGDTRTITSSTGTGITVPTATTTTAGWLSTADKTKLDGIAAGAQVNVGTDLGITGTGDTRTITSSTGANVTVPVATLTTAGLMSLGDKTKLDGIATGATANTGTVTSVAATAGIGISVTGSPITTSGTLTITNTAPHQATNLGYTTAASTGTVTSSTGTGATLPAATTALAGLMTGADKTKLDGIQTGAQVNVATNLGYTTAASNGTVTSSTGTNATLPAATTALAGLLTGADKTKLDGIAAGAQVNVGTDLGITGTGDTRTITSSTGANVTIPVATTTTAGWLSIADKAKLDGVQAGAQVNVATNLGYTTAASTGTVTSSTGTNATLPAATTALAGLMTGADKTKLDDIATGATANTGTVTSVAAAAGTGITITGSPITTSGTLTITNSAPHQATNLTYTAATTTGTVNSSTGTNVTLPAATTVNAGLLTGADKTKLDGIQTGAQVNVGTDLGITGTGDTRTITSSTGTNVTVPVATTATAGLMSLGDKTKLDGIQAGAQVNIGTDLTVTNGTTAGPVINSSTGANATLPTASGTISGVVTTGAQTFAGVKTFSSTITGSVSGNAGSATTLQTGRNISLSGGATGTATLFNGSADIAIPVTALNATNLTAGTVPDGRVTGTYTNFSHRLDGSNTIFTLPNTGSTSTLARTVYGLAEYRSAAASQVGAIVFIAPTTTSTIMHQLELQGLLYNQNIVRMTVQGYRTTGAWNDVRKISFGTVDIQTRWGVTPDGKNCLILGDVATAWSYPHISIVRAMFSHTNVADSYCTGWSVAVVTDLSLYTNVTATITDSTLVGNVSGNAATATTLQTGRTLTIGSTGKSFNGSGNVSWTLAEIGANFAAGNGVSLSGTTFSVAGGAGLTQDVGGLSMTAITAGDATVGAVRYNSTTRTAGQFYGGATSPVSTNRLNYDGDLHLNNLTTVGDVNSVSDTRFKTNWRSLPEDFLDQLSEVQYGIYDRLDIDATQAGVSAQDLRSVLPEVITENEAGYLSVNYGAAALVAIIELTKQVKELKEELSRVKKGLCEDGNSN